MRKRLLYRASRALNRTVRIVVAARERILGFRNSKQENAVHAERIEYSDLLDRTLHRVALDARHRGDLSRTRRVLDDEQRLDQL